MAEYSFKETHICSYKDKNKVFTIKLDDTNYPTKLFEVFSDIFAEEIKAGICSYTFIEDLYDEMRSIWKIKGLFYWDGVPVANLEISFHIYSAYILDIKGGYFSITENYSKLELNGLHKNEPDVVSLNKHFSDDPQGCYSANYINAAKTYKRNSKEILIELKVWDKPIVYTQPDGKVVCPLELRENPNQRSVLLLYYGLDLKGIKEIVKPHCRREGNEYVQLYSEENEYAQLYKLDCPAYLMGHPIDELFFILKTVNKHCSHFEISLSEKTEYNTKEKMMFLIKKIIKAWDGHYPLITKDDETLVYNGTYYIIVNDNLNIEIIH